MCWKKGGRVEGGCSTTQGSPIVSQDGKYLKLARKDKHHIRHAVGSKQLAAKSLHVSL